MIEDIFEERANDKCGTYRCDPNNEYCSCRRWANETAEHRRRLASTPLYSESEFYELSE